MPPFPLPCPLPGLPGRGSENLYCLRMTTDVRNQPHTASLLDTNAIGANVLNASDTFVRRHIGPNADDIKSMLAALGIDSLDELIDQTVPAAIRIKRPLQIGEPRGEFETLNDLREIAKKNQVFRSMIGTGYADMIVP